MSADKEENLLREHILNRLIGLEQWHDYAHKLYSDEQRRIARSFKHYRTSSLVTATSVAKELQCSKMFVSDLERGNRLFHEDMARKYLDAVDKLRKKS